MKKLFSLACVVVFAFALSVSALAGDVPEALLGQDESKVFIGTVVGVKLKGDISLSSLAEIDTVDVVPTEKIKGDVNLGVKETYTATNNIADIQTNKEYLFGYIDENNFYIYEIESRDEKSIRLKDSDKFDMTKRLEDYLNEGAFLMAEKERATLGEKISLLDFLYKEPTLSNEDVEKVTLRVQDDVCEVPKDEFFKIAEEIKITNVKNGRLHDEVAKPEQPDPYTTTLYIELLDRDGHLVSFAAVSRHGEVDRYALMMSRLMMKDYEMEKEDLEKLYSLFSDDVESEIGKPEALAGEQTGKTVGRTVGGLAVILLLAFGVGFGIWMREHK